jgi:hypothetical protein
MRLEHAQLPQIPAHLKAFKIFTGIAGFCRRAGESFASRIQIGIGRNSMEFPLVLGE